MLKFVSFISPTHYELRENVWKRLVAALSVIIARDVIVSYPPPPPGLIPWRLCRRKQPEFCVELKHEQEKAVVSSVEERNVFVSPPTGYGKSLCFGLLPRVFNLLRGKEKNSIAVVVSALGSAHA